jgi:hypothetical protein
MFMYFAYVIVLTCRKALAKDKDEESHVEILCSHWAFGVYSDSDM